MIAFYKVENHFAFRRKSRCTVFRPSVYRIKTPSFKARGHGDPFPARLENTCTLLLAGAAAEEDKNIGSSSSGGKSTSRNVKWMYLVQKVHRRLYLICESGVGVGVRGGWGHQVFIKVSATACGGVCGRPCVCDCGRDKVSGSTRSRGSYVLVEWQRPRGAGGEVRAQGEGGQVRGALVARGAPGRLPCEL